MSETSRSTAPAAGHAASAAAGPAPPSALQRASWALTRVLLRTVGRASDGVRLCLDRGLTSGTMLDYVYRNRPSGRWLIGPAIDRVFLGSPGWQAVRDRRSNLEALMLEGIEQLRAQGRPIALLDVASGPAGYILSVLERAGGGDIMARCRDLDDAGLARGREAAAARGLSQVTFEKGDALDRDAILALRPRPNLAVASGFYDWITDDEVVRRSIAIVAEALEPGGVFVVTNQVAHPDLAFVTAVFTDFHHQPLRMKMRPAATVEAWLGESGLVIERTVADRHGYYSVSRARKP